MTLFLLQTSIDEVKISGSRWAEGRGSHIHDWYWKPLVETKGNQPNTCFKDHDSIEDQAQKIIPVVPVVFWKEESTSASWLQAGLFFSAIWHRNKAMSLVGVENLWMYLFVTVVHLKAHIHIGETSHVLWERRRDKDRKKNECRKESRRQDTFEWTKQRQRQQQ